LIEPHVHNIDKWRRHAAELGMLQWTNVQIVHKSDPKPDIDTLLTLFSENCKVLLDSGSIADIGIVPSIPAPAIPTMPECLLDLAPKHRAKLLYQPFINNVMARFGIVTLDTASKPPSTKNATYDAQIRMCEFIRHNYGTVKAPVQTPTDKVSGDDDEFDLDDNGEDPEDAAGDEIEEKAEEAKAKVEEDDEDEEKKEEEEKEKVEKVMKMGDRLEEADEDGEREDEDEDEDEEENA
jgi:hypothetical protein